MDPKYQFIEVVLENGKPYAKIDRLIPGLIFGFSKFDTKTLDKEMCQAVLRGISPDDALAVNNEYELRRALLAIHDWEMAHQAKPGCDM